MIATVPTPSAPIPAAPTALVARLQQTERQLAIAIDHWDKSAPPPRAVTFLALYEQRVIRVLASDASLARRVGKIDPAIRDDVVARTDLSRLAASSPSPHTQPHIGTAAPASRLLGWYREAQRRFHVRWQILAAVNFVESAFNKVRNRSGAGAQGPMQFEPATWKAYGLGGDISDPRDAIFGAANYLAANGGAQHEGSALYRYNHSPLYVDAVLRYANRIRRDPHAFYDYYSWQVYFRTPTGDRRVTGPR